MSFWSGNSTTYNSQYTGTNEQNIFDQALAPDPVAIWQNTSNQLPTIMERLENDPNYTVWTSLVKKAGFEPLYRNKDLKITAIAIADRDFFSTASYIIDRLSALNTADIVAFHTLKAPYAMNDLSALPFRKLVKTYYPLEDLLINAGAANIYLARRPLSNSLAPTALIQSKIIPSFSDVLASNGIIHSATYPLIPTSAS